MCRSASTVAAALSHSSLFSEALSPSSKYQTIQRIRILKSKKVVKLKRTQSSAILVSLCSVEGIPSLLYTLRSQDLRSHSGQVSFPGGQFDESDRDVIHTAIRETEEEIGIPQSSIDVWEVLPPIGRYYMNPIHPVVGNLGSVTVDDLMINDSEVSKVFTVPLEYLCCRENIKQTSFRPPVDSAHALPYILPVFTTKPRIWGLTAVATELFLSTMYPGIFPRPVGKFLPR
ncbi:mitochondrial coenzyme A diphosphatase NUDT8-like [Styela clava]